MYIIELFHYTGKYPTNSKSKLFTKLLFENEIEAFKEIKSYLAMSYGCELPIPDKMISKLSELCFIEQYDTLEKQVSTSKYLEKDAPREIVIRLSIDPLEERLSKNSNDNYTPITITFLLTEVITELDNSDLEGVEDIFTKD